MAAMNEMEMRRKAVFYVRRRISTLVSAHIRDASLIRPHNQTLWDRFFPSQGNVAEVEEYLKTLEEEPYVAVVMEAGREIVRDTLLRRADVAVLVANETGDPIDVAIKKSAEGDANVSVAMSNTVAKIQEAVEFLILAIAKMIEDRSFIDLNKDIETINIRHYRDRAQAFLSAIQDLYVSVRSLSVALNIFKEVNEEIAHQVAVAQQDPSDAARQRELDLLIKNAVIIYEMANISYLYINMMQTMGLDKIKQIHSDVVKELNDVYVESQRIRRELARDPNVDDEFKELTFSELDRQDEMRTLTLQLWQDIFETFNDNSDKVKDLKKKAKKLVYIRDTTLNRLKGLSAITLTTLIKSNITSINEIADLANSMEAVRLSSEDLHRLLGLKKDTDEDSES